MSNHFALSISRLFAVIVNLSQQSPSVEPVLTSFLSLLDDLLLLKNLKVDIESIDLTLVGWLLLLLAHVLDACIVQCKPSATAVGKENNFLFVGILFWVACTSKKDKMADAWPKGVGSKNCNFLFYFQMMQTLLKYQMEKTERHRLLARANHLSLQRVAKPVNEADGTSCFRCRQANQLALQVI